MGGSGKQAVDDFVRRAVPANGDEATVSSGVGVPCQLGGVAWRSALRCLQLNTGGTQAINGWSEKFATAASTRRGIDNRKITIDHSSTTAEERSSFLPISSASSVRLIFIEAVRGKSLSHKV